MNLGKKNLNFVRTFNKGSNIEIEEKNSRNNNHLYISPHKKCDISDVNDEISNDFELGGEGEHNEASLSDVVVCVSVIDFKDIDLNPNLFSKDYKKAIKGEMKKKEAKKNKMDNETNSLDLSVTDSKPQPAKESDEKMKKKLINEVMSELNQNNENFCIRHQKIFIIVAITFFISLLFFVILILMKII